MHLSDSRSGSNGNSWRIEFQMPYCSATKKRLFLAQPQIRTDQSGVGSVDSQNQSPVSIALSITSIRLWCAR
jgi:hypothetical protein